MVEKEGKERHDNVKIEQYIEKKNILNVNKIKCFKI